MKKILKIAAISLISLSIFSCNKENENTKKEVNFSDFTYYNLDQNHLTPSLPVCGKINILVLPMVVKGFEEYATSDNLARINDCFIKKDTYKNYYSVEEFYETSSYNQVDLEFVVPDKYFEVGLTPIEIYMEKDKYSGDYGMFYCLDEGVKWYKEEYHDDCTRFDSDKDGFIDAIWMIPMCPNYYNYQYDSKFSAMYWAITYWNLNNKRKGNLDSPLSMAYSWCPYDLLNQGYGSNGVDTHTFIHETGHLFGLLDLYDTVDYTNSPAGNVEMMDFNIGDLNAFNKYSLGWIKPQIIKESAIVTLKDFESSGDAILIGGKNFQNGSFDEYFLFEYVSPTKLNQKDYTSKYKNIDRYIQGYSESGIKISHIDNRGVTSTGTLSYNPKEITENYNINTKSGAHTYNDNAMFLDTIFPANYVKGTSSDPFSGTYKESNDVLFKEGSSFSMSSNSKYISLMPSNSNKLNKYKMSLDDNDILDFKVDITSLNDNEATLSITIN